MYPTLSASLFVQGSNIAGVTALSFKCVSNGIIGSISTSAFPLTGTIATDGTFQVTSGTLGSPTVGTLSLSLTGNSPLAATPSQWTGTYSFVLAPGSNGDSCSITQTANFIASSIAPVTGTYIGVPANPTSIPEPFGPGAAVSVQIAQGSPTLVTQGTINTYQIPLTANLTITNSACALSASTNGAFEPSSINGDSFDLFFPVPGSPGGELGGILNDVTANSFFANLTSLSIANGCSKNVALYNFTRQ